MNTLKQKLLFILLPMLVSGLNLQAQQTYTLAPNPEFIVAGTSSIHDWTMTSKTAAGSAVIDMDNNALKGIESLTISMKTESLKSGKSGMDDNAYKALKVKKNPDIKFNLKQVKSIGKKGDQYLVVADGTVTIAGETKPLTLQALADPGSNSIQFKGNKTFKMSDFKVDPPTALMGTIKTGDEITINYNITFKAN